MPSEITSWFLTTISFRLASAPILSGFIFKIFILDKTKIIINDYVPNYSEIIMNLEKLIYVLKELIIIKDFLNANGFNLDFKFTGKRIMKKLTEF